MSMIYATRTIPLSLLIGISLLLGSIRVEAQVSSSSKTLKFLLAAVAQVNTTGPSQIVPVVDNMVLQSGNLIKFYLELEKEGYIYLFHEDSRGELVLLFPKDSMPAKVPKDISVYIPEGNSWIELDSNAGKETFHFLISSVQLEQLESLYNQHIMLKERNAITQSSQAVLTEIKSLRRKNLGKQAERPVIIAGKIRGNPPGSPVNSLKIEDFASEITSTGTFVKSVTIDHR